MCVNVNMCGCVWVWVSERCVCVYQHHFGVNVYTEPPPSTSHELTETDASGKPAAPPAIKASQNAGEGVSIPGADTLKIAPVTVEYVFFSFSVKASQESRVGLHTMRMHTMQ